MNRLSDEEAAQLEANLLHEGCRDPLVVWQEENLLLDGHNRFDICQKHDLPYEVQHVSLPSRQAALKWMFENQLGRRNWTPYQRAEMALQLKPEIAEQAKRNERLRKGKQPGASSCQESDNLIEPVDTKKELAEKAGVSHDTISRAEFLSQHANDKTKEKLRRGDTTINKEYQRLKKEQNAQERQQRKSAPVVIRPDDRCRCITSAIADAHLHVEPGSVDFVITDPPYPQEYLPVYSELSVFASHALKEGGSLLCMVGQSYLPELIERLQERLDYHWTLAYMDAWRAGRAAMEPQGQYVLEAGALADERSIRRRLVWRCSHQQNERQRQRASLLGTIVLRHE